MAESPAIRAAKDSYALTAGPSGATRDTTRTTRWLEIRRTTVAVKTWQTDRELLRLVPTSLQALQVSAVSGREVARSFESLLSRGLGHTSVVRYRASLSVFFAWCVREKLIATNPVTAVRVPKSSAPPVELHPFTEDELEAVYDAWALRDPRLADVMLVLGWTGLRWAEARELRVGDFVEVPSPALLVRRSAPEGVGVKATKSGRSRRVPVANRVLPIIKRFTLGKGPDDLLLTTYMGAQLHRNAVARTLDWKATAQGRRIHDLRHTAACLWLARGVDPGTVQAWMGHESIATTNRYLHHLGTGADIAGLARLNEDRGSARGGAITQKSKEPRMTGIVLPSQRGFLLVEHRGFEPLTFSLRTRRATNCANAPNNAVTLPHPGDPRHGRDSVDKDLVSPGLSLFAGDVVEDGTHVLNHHLDVRRTLLRSTCNTTIHTQQPRRRVPMNLEDQVRGPVLVNQGQWTQRLRQCLANRLARHQASHVNLGQQHHPSRSLRHDSLARTATGRDEDQQNRALRHQATQGGGASLGIRHRCQRNRHRLIVGDLLGVVLLGHIIDRAVEHRRDDNDRQHSGKPPPQVTG